MSKRKRLSIGLHGLDLLEWEFVHYIADKYLNKGFKTNKEVLKHLLLHYRLQDAEVEREWKQFKDNWYKKARKL